MNIVLLLCLVALGWSEPSELRTIQDWLLPNSEERADGMRLYLRQHFGANAPTELKPKMVVLHWTGVSTAKSTWYTFAGAALGGRLDIKGAGDVNVSAHYLIDRDGTIYRLVPETEFARHCIGFNHIAIGVENVGGTDGHPLTTAQVAANVWLIKDLQTRYPIELVIGHHESKELEHHPYFVEQDSTYRSIKRDPGDDFMEAVRIELALSTPSYEGG